MNTAQNVLILILLAGFVFTLGAFIIGGIRDDCCEENIFSYATWAKLIALFFVVGMISGYVLTVAIG